jgi:hypothetical protein
LGISLALKSNQTKRENNEIEENKSIKKKQNKKHIVIKKMKTKLDIQNKYQGTPTLYQIKETEKRGEGRRKQSVRT